MNSVSETHNLPSCNLMSDLVEGWRVSSGIPSVAAAIVRDGEIEWFRGFGETEIGNGNAPTQHSRFRIASNTKTFTAAALMLMSEASMLALEDPLLVHLPEFASAGNRGGDLEDVTLRRLATHHSGLMTEHPLTDWSRHSFPTSSEVLNGIDAVSMVVPTDTMWKYSNLAYGLLGEVVQRLSGKKYQSWLTEELLRPLGMSDSTFQFAEIPEGQRVNGYLPPRPGTSTLRLAPTVELNSMEAAGQMWSSISDLAKWVGFMTGLNPNDATVPISRRYLDEMIRPAYVDDDWKLGQCIGWRATRSRDSVYLGHGGGIHGFSSATIWNRSSGVGVILLASMWPESTCGTIARKLLEMTLNPSGAQSHNDLPPDTEVSGSTDSPLSRHNGDYFAEPGLTRTVVAISQEDLHLGFEDSAISGRIPTIATSTYNGNFTVRSGRAAGETVAFRQDGAFRMSNFTFEPMES